MITPAVRKKQAGYSTRPGYVNGRGQIVIRNTGLPGTDYGQAIYQMACSVCGHVYGSNGSDIYQRRCPLHDRGAPGLKYDRDMFGTGGRLVH